MILEMSENESIKLNEEIKALTLYLELEKMRFDNDFMFNIEMATTVDLEMVKIPSMLIQPYVENAVKHGLLHKEGEKHLSIKFDKENKYLKVTIEDNGIGRKKSEELNKIKDANHASYATQANLKRLEILNKDLENSKPIEIIDLLDKNNLPQGTKVILYIPIS
jgi:LytS/YehU family sensor histidine kinase